MKARLPIHISAMLIFGACLHLQAQKQPTPYVTGSTVTGHVMCADTNAPARFAKVLLKSTQPSHAGQDFMKGLTDSLQKAAKDSGNAAPAITPDKKEGMAAVAGSFNQVMDMMNATTVGLDGSYSFAGVKPGTYYVHAIYPGYIDPVLQFKDEDFSSADPAIRAKLAQLPMVTVTGADSAHAEVLLQRGAALSGRLTYDDGTPAQGWALNVMAVDAKESLADVAKEAMSQAMAMSGGGSVSKSDDQGHFRISGLLPGDYRVKATMTAPALGVNATNIGDGGTGIRLVAYLGDTFSLDNAKTLHVGEGEEVGGVDIAIPSHALHSIVGHVYAKADGHAINGGSVTLAKKDNPSMSQAAAIRDDGSFHFEYLPSGVSYTLTIGEAEDVINHEPSGKGFMGMNLPDTETLRKYKTANQDVQLGDNDLTAVQFSLDQSDWKPSPNKANGNVDPSEFLKNLLNGASDAMSGKGKDNK